MFGGCKAPRTKNSIPYRRWILSAHGAEAMPVELPIVDLMRERTELYPCSYLPEETARLEFRFVPDLTAAQWQHLLQRGWRRHGLNIFRPACPACAECRSLRVDVSRFSPSKSQRRTLRKNDDVTVELALPEVSDEHLRVFNEYHADMHDRRQWRFRQSDADDYYESFLAGDWSFAREMRFLRDGRLIGVGLVDVVPEGLSSIYFYHDPEWRPRGPGTFSVLKEFEHIRESGGRYDYLGYWVSGCPSMTYKANFVPHELLDGHVRDDEGPVWSSVES